MSTEPSPAPAAAPATPPKKPRNPVERLIVWGGIVLLLALAGVQAHARYGYEMTLKKLQARIAADDATANAPPLLVTEVPDLIVGWPTKTLQKDRHWERVTYKWRGLTQSYEISMPYDASEAQPAILLLETKGAPPEQPPTADAEQPALAGGEEGSQAGPPESYGSSEGGYGPPGGSGGPGGGQRFNLMESDADGDGKVSRAEAPERFAPNFDRADANGDGFIDADEYAEYRRIRAAERAAADGGGEGGRPRPAETPAADAPSEKPDAPADAEKAAEKPDAPVESKNP